MIRAELGKLLGEVLLLLAGVTERDREAYALELSEIRKAARPPTNGRQDLLRKPVEAANYALEHVSEENPRQTRPRGPTWNAVFEVLGCLRKPEAGFEDVWSDTKSNYYQSAARMPRILLAADDTLQKDTDFGHIRQRLNDVYMYLHYEQRIAELGPQAHRQSIVRNEIMNDTEKSEAQVQNILHRGHWNVKWMREIGCAGILVYGAKASWGNNLNEDGRHKLVKICQCLGEFNRHSAALEKVALHVIYRGLQLIGKALGDPVKADSMLEIFESQLKEPEKDGGPDIVSAWGTPTKKRKVAKDVSNSVDGGERNTYKKRKSTHPEDTQSTTMLSEDPKLEDVRPDVAQLDHADQQAAETLASMCALRSRNDSDFGDNSNAQTSQISTQQQTAADPDVNTTEIAPHISLSRQSTPGSAGKVHSTPDRTEPDWDDIMKSNPDTVTDDILLSDDWFEMIPRNVEVHSDTDEVLTDDAWVHMIPANLKFEPNDDGLESPGEWVKKFPIHATDHATDHADDDHDIRLPSPGRLHAI